MSRLRKKKVWFDAQEVKWLAHYVARNSVRLKEMAEQNPKFKEYPDYKNMQALEPKIVEWPNSLDDKGQLVVSLRRNEIRFLQRLTELQLRFNEKALETYEERSASSGDDFSKYISKLRVMEALLTNLNKKLGGRL